MNDLVQIMSQNRVRYIIRNPIHQLILIDGLIVMVHIGFTDKLIRSDMLLYLNKGRF